MRSPLPLLALALVGCAHVAQLHAPTDRTVYVLVKTPPFERGFVLRCVTSSDGSATRCRRILWPGSYLDPDLRMLDDDETAPE